MANITKKALNFDLDTTMLKQVYNKNSYTNAYYEIRSFLEKNGFEHRQGSGYVSQKPMTTNRVSIIVRKMNQEFTWLADCVREFDVTSVGKSHSLLDKFTKDNEIEKEEPILGLSEEEDFDYEMEM